MLWYPFVFFGAIITLILILVIIVSIIMAYTAPTNEQGLYYRQLGKNFKRNFLKNLAKILRP